MSAGSAAPAQQPATAGGLVRRGAELVAVTERFHEVIFAGAAAFTAAASVAALAFLPLRESATNGRPPTGALVAGLAVLACAIATAARHRPVYRALRRRPALELGPAVASALLLSVASPLRNELWWPACGILMVLATLAPLRRALVYALLALLANLAAHVAADDLADTSAVGILGLWIGLPFWTALAGVVPDRLAAHLMRLHAGRPAPPRPAPVPTEAWVAPPGPTEPDPTAPGPTAPRRGGAAGPDRPPASAPGPRGSSYLRATAGHGARPVDDVDPPAVDAPPADGPSADPPPADAPADTGRLGRLTARQLEVVALLADGLQYAAIAACLSIKPAQVARHVSAAVRRLGVRSPSELVAVAVAEGLVPSRGADDRTR